MMNIDGHTLYRLNYPLRLNKWYHSCQSWSGRTGEWQIWVNDERVGRGFNNRVSEHSGLRRERITALSLDTPTTGGQCHGTLSSCSRRALESRVESDLWKRRCSVGGNRVRFELAIFSCTEIPATDCDQFARP